MHRGNHSNTNSSYLINSLNDKIINKLQFKDSKINYIFHRQEKNDEYSCKLRIYIS